MGWRDDPIVQTTKKPKWADDPVVEAAAPETLTDQMLGGGAATLDLIAESAAGLGSMLAYPVARAASFATGQSPEEIEASLGRVTGAVSAPVGRALGVSESPAYKRNPAKQAMEYVGEAMNSLAATISGATGVPEPDVRNMLQVATSAAPIKAPVAKIASKVPGAKIPGKVARATVSKVQDVFDPKTKFYMDVAEGRGGELVRAARRPEAEVLPGQRPTFAQATADVGVPRVAAVGEQAEKLQPTAAIARRDAQEAARVAQLKAIEQTPEVRAKAEAARERRTEPLYREAEMAGDVVDVAPTLDYIDSLVETNPGNPQLLAELRRVRKGLVKRELDENGDPVLVPRTNAKEIASTLDGLKTALAKEDNKFIKKELTNIKEDLTAAIPSMKEAQEKFRKGSKPINQMDVGKYLREKLETALPEGRQRPGVFAEAVRNAPLTIKNALTGKPRYAELTDVLSPPQQARVDAVMRDLSRDARVQELAQLGRETAPKLKEPAGKFSLPPLLDRLATIANEIMRRLEGKINEKLAMEIAMEFLDADRAAAALETAMQRSAKRGRIPQPVAKPPVNAAAAAASRAIKRAPVATAPNQMRNEEVRNRMAR